MRLTSCATLPHYNPTHAQVKTSQTKLKTCSDGGMAKQQAAGADTLEAVVISLHAGDPGHRVALYWNEAAVEFGSPLGV